MVTYLSICGLIQGILDQTLKLNPICLKIAFADNPFSEATHASSLSPERFWGLTLGSDPKLEQCGLRSRRPEIWKRTVLKPQKKRAEARSLKHGTGNEDPFEEDAALERSIIHLIFLGEFAKMRRPDKVPKS